MTAFSCYSERQSLYVFRLVGQHRKVVLFSVGKSTCVGHYFAYKQRAILRSVEFETHHCLCIAGHAEFFAQLFDYGFGCGVLKYEISRTRKDICSNVTHRSRNNCLIALAKIARHVGLHHEILGHNGCCVEQAYIHILCMRQKLEIPFCHAFRNCKGNGYVPVVISSERRHEERRLGKILAHLYFGYGFLSIFSRAADIGNGNAA